MWTAKRIFPVKKFREIYIWYSLVILEWVSEKANKKNVRKRKGNSPGEKKLQMLITWKHSLSQLWKLFANSIQCWRIKRFRSWSTTDFPHRRINVNQKCADKYAQYKTIMYFRWSKFIWHWYFVPATNTHHRLKLEYLHFQNKDCVN